MVQIYLTDFYRSSHPLFMNLCCFFWILACTQTTESSNEPLNPMIQFNNPNLPPWNRLIESLHLENPQDITHGIQIPLQKDHYDWILSIQYFPSHEILYIALNNYLWLDQTPTPQRSVFLMTQLLIENHNMLGGKFQLNPQNGAITLGIEIPVVDPISAEQIQKSIDTLLLLGVEKYHLLEQAQGAQHY